MLTIVGSTLCQLPAIFVYLDGEETLNEEPDGEQNSSTGQLLWYACKRIALVYLIYGLGQTITSVDIMLKVTGAFLGVGINYLIPGAFYNRAYSEEHLEMDKGAVVTLTSHNQ